MGGQLHHIQPTDWSDTDVREGGGFHMVDRFIEKNMVHVVGNLEDCNKGTSLLSCSYYTFYIYVKSALFLGDLLPEW
jgi:hypothetical protein